MAREKARPSFRWRLWLTVLAGAPSSFRARSRRGRRSATCSRIRNLCYRARIASRWPSRACNYAARAKVLRVFAGDYGRSIFSVPLDERRRRLLAVDWVEDAAVSRIWPNRLLVRITERQPVAFVSLPLHGGSGSAARFLLVDAQGVLLDPPSRAQFAFPVLTGLSDEQTDAERRIRVRAMQRPDGRPWTHRTEHFRNQRRRSRRSHGSSPSGGPPARTQARRRQLRQDDCRISCSTIRRFANTRPTSRRSICVWTTALLRRSSRTNHEHARTHSTPWDWTPGAPGPAASSAAWKKTACASWATGRRRRKAGRRAGSRTRRRSPNHAGGAARGRSGRRRFRWKRAVVGVGATVRGANCRGLHDLGRLRTVEQRDVNRAVERAKRVRLPEDTMILQMFPQDFVVDGHPGHRDPRKMIAGQIEANVHLVMTSQREHDCAGDRGEPGAPGGGGNGFRRLAAACYAGCCRKIAAKARPC